MCLTLPSEVRSEPVNQSLNTDSMYQKTKHLQTEVLCSPLQGFNSILQINPAHQQWFSGKIFKMQVWKADERSQEQCGLWCQHQKTRKNISDSLSIFLPACDLKLLFSAERHTVREGQRYLIIRVRAHTLMATLKSIPRNKYCYLLALAMEPWITLSSQRGCS